MFLLSFCSLWWSLRFLRQRRAWKRSWVWTLKTTARGVMERAVSRAPRCHSVIIATALAWLVSGLGELFKLFRLWCFPFPLRALPMLSVSHCTVYYCLCFHLQESVNKGPFMMRTTCRRCGGKGSIINTPCALCRGSGQTKKRQTVTVPVPAGRFSSWDHTSKGLNY